MRTFVADGNGDVAKVNSDIEDLLAKGVDGLIMNISPLEALPGGMAAIKKAGKPLVLVNRRLKGGEYDAWIGVDNFNTAAGVGEVIAKRMGGKGNLLMIRGGPEDNSTGNARRDGVLSKVKTRPSRSPSRRSSASGPRTAASASWRTCSPSTRTSTRCSARAT